MEDYNNLLDLPSPTHSLHYMYGGESELYMESNTSESQSPATSPVSLQNRSLVSVGERNSRVILFSFADTEAQV